MIKSILAMDQCFGIGKNGTLPWPKNSEDLKYFRKITNNHIVVMGSNTWNDPLFPSPLKNRDNYVISSKQSSHYNGCVVLNNSDGISVRQKIIDLSNTDKHVFIIGGSNIFEQFGDLSQEIYITLIRGCYDCDKFFSIDENLFETVNGLLTYKNSYLIYRRKN